MGKAARRGALAREAAWIGALFALGALGLVLPGDPLIWVPAALVAVRSARDGLRAALPLVLAEGALGLVPGGAGPVAAAAALALAWAAARVSGRARFAVIAGVGAAGYAAAAWLGGGDPVAMGLAAWIAGLAALPVVSDPGPMTRTLGVGLAMGALAGAAIGLAPPLLVPVAVIAPALLVLARPLPTIPAGVALGLAVAGPVAADPVAAQIAAAAALALAASLIAALAAARRRRADLEADLDRRAQRIRYLLSARDDVLALAVHDLQSPVQAVRGILETGLHLLDGPGADRRLHAALVSAARTCAEIARRVDGVLSDARAHRAEGSAPVPLAPIVREVLATHAIAAEAKGVTAAASVPTELRILDGEDVFDVLDVLVDNALRAAPRGGTLRIEGRVDGDRIALDVIDDGPGVAPAQVPHLFSGAGATAQRRGIGLPLAARRARLIGATLAYAPATPTGAQFTLSLPDATRGTRV